MAHTTKLEHTTFIHNGDAIEGEVEVITNRGSVKVEGRDLIEFGLLWITQQRINQLEQMTPEDFIKSLEL